MSNIMRIEADPFSDGWDRNYQNFDGSSSAWSDEPQPFIEKALRNITASSTVADLGAGDGRNTRLLVAAGHRVTALDISETALILNARRLHAVGLPPPTPVVSRIESIPIASGHFDAAVAADVLPQVEDTRRALEEVARILKPGGILFADIFTPRDCAFGIGEQIGPATFAFKGTRFRFLDAGELEVISVDLFEVIEAEHCTWWDPPHGAFRPYPHQHDAIFYVLKKR